MSATVRAAQVDEQRQYRRALGHYATGVAVVTTDLPDGVAAITINSFVSISLEPRLVMWSLSNASDRYDRFATREQWGLSILCAGQQNLAASFASKNARAVDTHELDRMGGTPVIKGALARFECRTAFCTPAGDHLLIFGLVERFDECESEALLYHRGAFGTRP